MGRDAAVNRTGRNGSDINRHSEFGASTQGYSPLRPFGCAARVPTARQTNVANIEFLCLSKLKFRRPITSDGEGAIQAQRVAVAIQGFLRAV